MVTQIRSGGAGIPRTKDSNGDPAGNVVAEIQQGAGVLETKEITINDGTDLFTSKLAPVAAELISVLPSTTGKKRCRITWHVQKIPYVQSATSDIPWAAMCVATINANDDVNALSRLAYVDNGAGAYTADGNKRQISESNPVIEWDLNGTDGSIDRVDIGAYAGTDTGTIPVYLSVEIW